ncbi:MAG: sulfatase [Candidatus Omnitrophica bacterium]|nr:Arylsulfatase [bacterium]NUN97074.1 sulfatase [Candidatus Omnitrophota bacterium]
MKPNLVYVFADQWRAQATGCTGDPNAKTPHVDALAGESLNFTHAVSGCPVCSPYRGSLLTGQYWLTHGVFLNDVCLGNEATSFAEALNEDGYDTAYIGKWHLDGHGRSSFIPRERRQGFQLWRVLECTHDYNDSLYYGDDPTPLRWEGYDAIAQTREAERYLREHKGEKPFALFLSWGPPHDPYLTAPQEYRDLFDPEKLVLRPNVPKEMEAEARKMLAGYYAHCAALDACVGDLLKTLGDLGQADNTLFIFTSDHGDMLYSHGEKNKQRPYDESIRVPFLLRFPSRLGGTGKELKTLLNTPDILPTVLGLLGINPPDTAEGIDFSSELLAGREPVVDAALYACPAPFGQWTRNQGGRECRGIRTLRHTYIRDLNGPWLLFDNETDPYQMDNLCGKEEVQELQARLDQLLATKLAERDDRFLPAADYIAKWNYTVDENGTVPYSR